MKTVELWRVIVGSHVWGMQHAESDTDYFTAYAVDTNSILRGEVAGGGAHFSEKVVPGGDDVQSHEVGKWVDMALKGNFNYVVGVFSPLVEADGFGYLKEFRDICRRGMARNVYPSIEGMARGNLVKYRKSGIEGVEWEKKLNGCARSVMFGISWMKGEGPRFNPVRGANETMVLDLLEEFKRAKDVSPLPESPPNEEEYRRFLFKVRVGMLSDVEGIYWGERKSARLMI